MCEQQGTTFLKKYYCNNIVYKNVFSNNNSLQAVVFCDFITVQFSQYATVCHKLHKYNITIALECL